MTLTNKSFEVSSIDDTVKMCTACQGEGRMRDETIPCYHCMGRGYIPIKPVNHYKKIKLEQINKQHE